MVERLKKEKALKLKIFLVKFFLKIFDDKWTIDRTYPLLALYARTV